MQEARPGIDAPTQSGPHDAAGPFRVPSDMFAGAFLGSLIGAVGVVLAKDLQVELILIGALILGFLGVVNGIGSTRR